MISNDIHGRAFLRALIKQNDVTAIYCGVKYINSKKMEDWVTRSQIEIDAEVILNIKVRMAILTPKEFMNIFPISKKMVIKKQKTNEYLSTINMLKRFHQR